MDVSQPCEHALTSAKLLPGDVAETVPKFLGNRRQTPVLGSVAFDLDYLQLDGPGAHRLPMEPPQHGSHAYFAISTTSSGQRPLVTTNT